MRVLVTNDDGVSSAGLAALAAGVMDEGHDVTVVAPARDSSGSGAAIGAVRGDQVIPYQAVRLAGFDGPAFALEGPPALAVMVARLGGFGEPPDMVASGINAGSNTGRAVLHSGTVGAALTAANFGASGLAVSLQAGEPPHWETAAGLAAQAVEWLATAPPGTVVNLNVPNRAGADVAGIRPARLAPFGTVRTAVVGAGEGRLQLEMRVPDQELPEDTDTALVRAGWVAVTAITGVRAVGEVDVADWLSRRWRG